MKNKNEKNKFPTPHTRSEFLALEEPRKEYDRAKGAKKFGAAVALLASVTIGIDTLSDHDVGDVSLISAPVFGAMASRAYRERKKQQEALEQAKSVTKASPSDLPIARNY